MVNWQQIMVEWALDLKRGMLLLVEVKVVLSPLSSNAPRRNRTDERRSLTTVTRIEQNNIYCRFCSEDLVAMRAREGAIYLLAPAIDV